MYVNPYSILTRKVMPMFTSRIYICELIKVINGLHEEVIFSFGLVVQNH